MANETKAEPANELDRLRTRVAELEGQLSRYRQLTATLGSTAHAAGAQPRSNIPTLCEALAEVTGADCVMLGELAADRRSLVSPTIFVANQARSAADILLAETACGEVVTNQSPRVLQKPREEFPRDALLAEHAAETFLGVPLVDRRGSTLGVLAVLWRGRAVDLPAAETVALLIALRAGLEIERRAADLALRALEARFDTFCQATPLGIFETDEIGSCYYVSSQWQAITGRPLESLLGFGWRQILHPDDVAAAREAWRVAHEQGRPYENEFRVQLVNGETRWARAVARRIVPSTGEPARYIGCVEDITDRKQAELARIASEEQFRAFMDNNPAVAFMKDTAGRRVYANQPYLKRFQAGDSNVMGKTDLELFGPALARKLGANDERVLAENKSIETVEAVPTADGVMHHWLVCKFPVEAPSGERYVGGVAVDITERMRAEEELRKARDELERRVAERTSRLTAMNARLEQEVFERTEAEVALQNERNLLRRLLYRHEADRKLIAYEIHDGLVQYITGSIMHLESARQKVKEVSAGATAELETTVGLLRETVQEARRVISGLQPLVLDQSGLVAAIQFLIDNNFPPDMVTFEHEMRSDRLSPLIEGAVFRICQEALTNAVKHSSSEKMIVRLRQENAWVRLEVLDQGVGFNPDRQLTNSFGLRGIRERARLLGGHALIDSAPGRGTRIAVELPLAEED